MLSAQFDHAVIVVPSLEPAVRSFERLGFHVIKGGRTGPVHNALILFEDGTYLEITTNRLSALRPVFRGLHAVGLTKRAAAKRDDMLRRFLPWIGASAGPTDWCIRVDDLRTTIAALRDNGLEMIDEMPFERKRPDGEVAKWLLAGPRDVRLPFLIEDLTPVEIRVPSQEHLDHRIGARGIRRIVLPRTSQEAFERAMGVVLRGDPRASSDAPEALGLAHEAERAFEFTICYRLIMLYNHWTGYAVASMFSLVIGTIVQVRIATSVADDDVRALAYLIAMVTALAAVWWVVGGAIEMVQYRSVVRQAEAD